MQNQSSGILIAALVAIVAVVGLVILFKPSADAAAVCPPGQTVRPVAVAGHQGYYACQPKLADVRIVPQQEQTISSQPYGVSFENPVQKRQRRNEVLVKARTRQ